MTSLLCIFQKLAEKFLGSFFDFVTSKERLALITCNKAASNTQQYLLCLK